LFDEITEEIAIEAINDFMDMTGGWKWFLVKM
jgi:hypothetical protein